MAACCILVAIILAQIAATLRRWGVFWGVITPDEFDDQDTLLRRVQFWIARPVVRLVAASIFAIEIASFSWWVSAYHGEHLYRLADQAVSGMRGQTVIYAGICDGSGRSQFRRISFTHAG